MGGDAHVEIASADAYNPNQVTEDPLPELPANIPAPIPKTRDQVCPQKLLLVPRVLRRRPKQKLKTMLLDSTLTELEFSANAVLDKSIGKSKGVVLRNS